MPKPKPQDGHPEAGCSPGGGEAGRSQLEARQAPEAAVDVASGHPRAEDQEAGASPRVGLYVGQRAAVGVGRVVG